MYADHDRVCGCCWAAQAGSGLLRVSEKKKLKIAKNKVQVEKRKQNFPLTPISSVAAEHGFILRYVQLGVFRPRQLKCS